MGNNRIQLRPSLSLFSLLYGAAVEIRNRFFDWGILRSKQYPLPVISVGNLAVGGTGKTPHIDYLIELLSHRYNIAVLSRGYKRASQGFVLATPQSTATDLGDEPYQLKRRYPYLIVAVDGNRCRGIEKLLELEPKVEVILLDDAFQHRYVTPSYSLLLTDFNRPFYEDKLLPVGRLREPAWEKRRADMILVTKCPEEIKPMEARIMQKWLDLYPFQSLFFTKFRYDRLQPLNTNIKGKYNLYPTELPPELPLLIVTGIAHPESLLKYLSRLPNPQKHLSYGDHHDFSPKDMQEITQHYRSLANPEALIIVTEKDAARLFHHKLLSEELKEATYYLPIQVEFLQETHSDFDFKIIDHVRKNRRNSKLPS